MDSDLEVDNSSSSHEDESDINFKLSSFQGDRNEKPIQSFVHSDNVIFKSSDTTNDSDTNSVPFTVKSKICSFNCSKTCADVVKYISTEDLDSIKQRLKNQSDVKTKNNLLNHLKWVKWLHV